MLRTGAARAVDVLPRRRRQCAHRVHGSVYRRGDVDRLGGRECRLRARLRRSRRHPRRRRRDRDQVPEHLMPALTDPRTAPPTLLPALAGGIVVLTALPIFLIAGWRVEGWALGAVLWFASEAFGAVLTRLRTRTGNLAAAGVAAFGMLFRAIAVMVVIFAVAVSDKWLGLAAALTYAAGYSAALGLQLVAYYTGPRAGAAA